MGGLRGLGRLGGLGRVEQVGRVGQVGIKNVLEKNVNLLKK